MERAFLSILENVRDKKRFGEFLNFCVLRLRRGENVPEIWEEWKEKL